MRYTVAGRADEETAPRLWRIEIDGSRRMQSDTVRKATCETPRHTCQMPVSVIGLLVTALLLLAGLWLWLRDE